MNAQAISTLVWATVIIVLIVWLSVATRKRRKRPSYGPGMSGAIYDLLNEDKRRATELIVEQKAEARRPEYPDGTLPDLEDPKRLS